MDDYSIEATFSVKVKNLDGQIADLQARMEEKYGPANKILTSKDNLQTREYIVGYILTFGRHRLAEILSKKFKRGFKLFNYELRILQNGEGLLRIAPKDNPDALKDEKDICDIINSVFK